MSFIEKMLLYNPDQIKLKRVRTKASIFFHIKKKHEIKYLN